MAGSEALCSTLLGRSVVLIRLIRYQQKSLSWGIALLGIGGLVFSCRLTFVSQHSNSDTIGFNVN
jgi:hypothetical protein